MVNPYLVGAPAAGAGALLVVKSVFKNRETKNSKKGEKEQRRGAVTDDEASFACERVCASDRLLKRMGGLAKVRMMRIQREKIHKKRAMREKRARIAIVRFNPPPGDDDESGEGECNNNNNKNAKKRVSGKMAFLNFDSSFSKTTDQKVSIFVLRFT